MITEISAKKFEAKVLKADKPVLVEVWAPWCGPCKAMAPVLDNVAKEFNGKAQVIKLNADKNPELVKQFKVMGIPTLLFFSHGKLVDRKTGAQSEEAITRRMQPLLNLSAEDAARREVTGLIRWPAWMRRIVGK
jgi:thioredoxin 1